MYLVQVNGSAQPVILISHQREPNVQPKFVGELSGLACHLLDDALCFCFSCRQCSSKSTQSSSAAEAIGVGCNVRPVAKQSHGQSWPTDRAPRHGKPGSQSEKIHLKAQYVTRTKMELTCCRTCSKQVDQKYSTLEHNHVAEYWCGTAALPQLLTLLRCWDHSALASRAMQH